MEILIVEDNAGDFYLEREMILDGELAKSKIYQVEDLASAIVHLSRYNPDVILLDLSLPDSKGLDSIREIYINNHSASLIVLTGLTDQKMALEAIKQGADDYLIKGDFDSRLLERTIKYSLERRKNRKLLEKSQEKYQELFENNPLPMWAYNITTLQILMVNDAAVEFYGYSKEEFYKLTLLDLRPQEDIRKLREDLGKAENIHHSGSWRHISKTGKIFEVEVASHAMVFEETNARLAVIYDVTEKKKQEEHSRLLESVIINTNDGVMITVPSKDDITVQSTIYVNEAFTRFSGYTMADIRGKSPKIMQGEKTDRAQLDKIRKAIQRATPIEAEMINYTKRGQEFWVIMNIVPVFSEKGEITHFISVQRDITEKKNDEIFLKKEKERYDLINKATSEIIWDWDLQTNQVFRNENYQAKFGYPVGEYTDNTDWEDRIHPEDRIKVLTKLAKGISDPSTNFWEDEYRLVKQDGDIAYIHDRGYIIYNENGDPIRMLGAMKDITARKYLEIEKDTMTSDLLQRNKDLEQFAYIISHNLRAPVANILGFVDLLADDTIPSDKTLFLNQLGVSAKKLDAVIQDLNNILQIRREIDEVKESVDLKQLILDINESISGIIEKGQIKIKTDFNEVPKMLTIKSYLQSIFYNLIINSIKYRNPEVPCVINIKSDIVNNHLEITFSDNGLGMDLERNAGKVFGLYKRFHLHIEGKGIGLFMTKTQVEALGGTIRIESLVNQGTTFYIRFKLNN